MWYNKHILIAKEIQYCPPICHGKGKSRRHREIAGLELKKYHKTDHYREFMTKGYMEKIL